MPARVDEINEWKDTWKRLVEGVQGRVEVERKVDAHEELPDEVK